MALTSTPTRGERNCNPGNLDYHPTIQWQGQLGVEVLLNGEPRFARFSAPVWGIRAAAKELINYITKDGCDTVEKIINRWAPPAENATSSYVRQVCNSTGFSPDQIMTATDNCIGPLVIAIIKQENGRCIYDGGVIKQAVASALGESQ